MEVLTEVQVDQFYEDGYLKFRRVISESEVEILNSATEWLEECLVKMLTECTVEKLGATLKAKGIIQ